MRSADHHYAEIAFKHVSSLIGDSNAESYGQLCHRFPIMVQTNGLRLTIIFFQAKVKNQLKQSKVFDQYLQHMQEVLGIDNWSKAVALQNADYLHLTRKALKASVWFKRYAEALLNVTQANEMTSEAGDL
ncbi:type III-B CRISPR module-associated protein Cmr5 [Bacillus sp. FJAT-27264]|uniref:type III-B CRISPR module-associated protein Cmr5 n=1 Tax=Paenibacillus sp. (strain DSM 101736 / FJAT-27264) TaxID=1850362 RepID=UPI000807C896|nr:type III-B CRISPR module-associated protein Cmr5 [Bacillus sp. FJAT-27264]OBZ15727.1 type III-B CRISPR module-associated protein Cmr5 [Bacillus sp. FJAT-27264]